MMRKILYGILSVIGLAIVGFLIYLWLVSIQFFVPSQVKNKPVMTSEQCKIAKGRVWQVSRKDTDYCFVGENVYGVVNDFYSPVSYSGKFNVCCVQK